MFFKKSTWISMTIAFVGCISVQTTNEAPVLPCEKLFGIPVTATGLNNEQCGPSCACGKTPFEAPVFSQQKLLAFLEKILIDPPEPLFNDPYVINDPPIRDENKVCAIVYESAQKKNYHLVTYENATEAKEAGAILTHFGECGACSSLADLVVYAANPDLSTPVRACGMKGMSGSDQINLDCLLDIGFTPACAQIWLYNTKNTRTKCLKECLLHLYDPFHKKDGSLNECLLCDEEQSGPIFKAYAGRTRRNSGLASAICRPCDTVKPVPHQY
ncbi:MAG: hypothetical protein V1754_04595 [Pseudomonadota bacterium]